MKSTSRITATLFAMSLAVATFAATAADDKGAAPADGDKMGEMKGQMMDHDMGMGMHGKSGDMMDHAADGKGKDKGMMKHKHMSKKGKHHESDDKDEGAK